MGCPVPSLYQLPTCPAHLLTLILLLPTGLLSSCHCLQVLFFLMVVGYTLRTMEVQYEMSAASLDVTPLGEPPEGLGGGANAGRGGGSGGGSGGGGSGRGGKLWDKIWPFGRGNGNKGFLGPPSK